MSSFKKQIKQFVIIRVMFQNKTTHTQKGKRKPLISAPAQCVCSIKCCAGSDHYYIKKRHKNKTILACNVTAGMMLVQV